MDDDNSMLATSYEFRQPSHRGTTLNKKYIRVEGVTEF